MTLTLSTKALVYVLKPLLLSILQEIITQTLTAENLTKIREKLYNFTSAFTGKTVFTWDDKLCEIVLSVLSTPEGYRKWGDNFLDIIEDWIVASETKWDDQILLPIIKTLREVAGIPDQP